jgi:hypothetical protein
MHGILDRFATRIHEADPRVRNRDFPFAIGLTVTMGILATGALTGGAMNPARGVWTCPGVGTLGSPEKGWTIMLETTQYPGVHSDDDGEQTIRGDRGASIMGPRNGPLERENPDLLASPDTDAAPGARASLSPTSSSPTRRRATASPRAAGRGR